jgi:hypothetical protein
MIGGRGDLVSYNGMPGLQRRDLIGIVKCSVYAM